MRIYHGMGQNKQLIGERKMQNAKTIKLKAKNVYGEVKHYPGCELSELIANISGKKTITENQQRILREAGYEIQVTAVV